MPSFSIAKMLKSIINRKGMPGVLFLILLSSCSGDSPVSRRYPCHFTFHTEWHPASMIFTALNTNNYYVSISMSVYHGAYVVNTSDPNGKKESITLTNDIENLAYSGVIDLHCPINTALSDLSQVLPIKVLQADKGFMITHQ